MKDSDIVMIYEYMSKAGKQSLNGYPIFTSFSYLNEDEYKLMCKYFKQIHEQHENFMNEDDDG